MSIFKAINNVLGVGTKTPSTPRVSSNSSTDRPADTSQSQLITFQNSWHIIKNSLSSPRQRHQLLESTSIKERLELMWECLAVENNIPITKSNPPLSPIVSQTPECVEYFLENDVPGNLVALSLPDQPIGVKGLVIKFFLSLVVFMDEKFVVHAKVHKPLVRLLRSCVEPELGSDEGDDAGWGIGSLNYEEAVVELMCHLCARIKTYPELLLVFIHNRSRSSQAQTAEAVDEPSVVQPMPITPSSSQTPAPTGVGSQPTTRKSVHFSPVPRPPSPLTSDFSAAGNTGNSPTHTTLSSSFSSSSHHLYNEATRKSDSKLAAIGNALKGDSDMLIFSYLLRFLHREGRTGDLARAGLLFLMELAMGRCSHPPGDAVLKSQPSQITDPDQPTPADTISMAFGEWVLDSDFADVLGASLGAAYGLLPSKLVITPRDPSSEDSTGRMVLGGMGIHFSEGSAESAQAIQEKEREERRQRLLIGLGVSGSAEFRTQIDLFLKMIEFAQDVMRNVSPSTLDHYVSPTELLLASQTPGSAFLGSAPPPRLNPTSHLPEPVHDESGPSPSEIVASAVSSTVLLSIRKSFLTGIIYPSLLECSENDGSAVAVMSYLEATLSLLETDGELSDSVLRFLMAEADEDFELDAGLRASSNQPEVMQLGPSSPFINPNRRNSGAISIIKADFNKAKSGRRVRNEGDRLMSDTGITYFNSLGRFTLKDLLVNNIQSTDSPTATAALKLLHVILVRHDRYALTLLDIIPDPRATAFPFPHSMDVNQKESGLDSDSQMSDNEESEFVYPTDGNQVNSDDEPDDAEEEFKYPGGNEHVKSASDENEEFKYPTPTKPLSALSSVTPATQSHAQSTSTGRSHCLKPSFDLVRSIHCSPCPTYRAHRDEIEFLSNLVELIDPSSMVMKADSIPGSLSTAFQHYLLDAEAELTGTATFRRGLLFDYVSASVIPSSQPAGDKRQSMRPSNFNHNQPASKHESPLDFIDQPVIRHRLSAETPLMSSILESLAKFFVQPPALNLILTGCVATLASCPTRSLEGWMLPIPNPDDDDDSFDQSVLSSCTPRNPIVDYDEGDDRSIDFAVDEYVSSHRKSSSRRTFESSFSRPQGASDADCLLEVYRQLAEQVAGYRRTITNFDKYLKERRQGLIFVENLEDALDTLTGTMSKSEVVVEKDQRTANPARQPIQNPKKPSVSPVEPPTKPKDSSFFSSFFKASNPSKSPSPTAPSPRTQSDRPTDPAGGRGSRSVAVKPFSDHYQQTGSIKLTIVPVSTPGSTKKRQRSLLKIDFSDEEETDTDSENPGPDTPTKKTLHGSQLPSVKLSQPSSRKHRAEEAPPDHPVEPDSPPLDNEKTVISLSMLLDNVVILEESIKELGAIISARKSLGIDPVRIL
ncbi:uncharacterized protein PGTG_05357 [Puccinia graminis f. sp. tritici CRL 75-36-700-3]|uniref:FHF complex subunit HOOK-interacting protein C-terminal domain-containing protein n=1 Tax=Puccinia graminis f. sp. tritici (strain CRL 75-36-700-3 / race SCCL) TaxID=418459 RepID=E3K795_PUCGT|nr:uncharacterized protein PGTG_05357 [Puccinia graminis f. sp. tritici CRL 75-36-700-3]EFP80132.1 hypothetical protein PGTG_05357 [Puccinia graminis f. sp. tritici CRL 75-36-700-3]